VIDFIAWVIAGSILGWIASMIMRTAAQPGMFLNIIVGIVGAALAGLVLSPLFGVSILNQNNFSLPALLISLIGAVTLLRVVNLLHRGSVQ
jgi:uncharacterized membrane protein YeaQ/YmgE (transglycosylase-associated protein family)